MPNYLLILLAAMLAGCGHPKRQVNILTFPDFIEPKAVASFEREFNCKVVIDYVDSGDTSDGKLKAGGATAYDIVSMSDVTSYTPLGFLAPLDSNAIPNLKNIDPQFDVLSFSGGVRYSVPYLWGATGLYVRKVGGRPVEDSWSLIFDAKKQRGPFYLLNESRTTIGAALRFLGHSVNSTDRRELAAAGEVLMEAKGRSLGFIDGTSVKNRIIAKDASAAIAWNGSSVDGSKEDPETQFLVPGEGSCMLLDGFSILAKAPHRDLADKFLNHILDARIGAQIANFLHIATANKAALEFIEPDDLKNPGIYPPPEVLKRLETVRELGEKAKLYDELWTQIKAK